MGEVKQSMARPAPGIVTERKPGTVPFEIKSRLVELDEAIEAARAAGQDASALEASAESLRAEGAVPWHVRGARRARLGAVEGHQVAHLQEQLIQRFTVEGEPLFHFDTSRISAHQCRSVAIVHTAIVSIEGGEPYNPEELLCMPFGEFEDLWVGLLGVGMAALSGNPAPGTAGG